MTVKQLIAKLQTLPENLEVYWADHDHGDYEWNDKVGVVKIVDFNKYESDVKNLKAYTVDKNFILKDKVVMLRPC